MKRLKRLFLFAAYDKEGVIDDALVYYIQQLKRYGDIILVMDSDSPKSEMEKINDYCLYAEATRHGEYDFGSYKRAYKWARENGILKDYDLVYLVNDSVFGPLFDVIGTLKRLEATSIEATGIIMSEHRTHSFLESWFIRLTPKVFMPRWFNEFISSVTTEPSKEEITIKYEHGLSNLILSKNLRIRGLYQVRGRYTYNQPKRLFRQRCPFIKKASFTRHNGALGAQIKYILDHTNIITRNIIMKAANRLYTPEYIQEFLTYNPIKILGRKIKYATHKLAKGKI